MQLGDNILEIMGYTGWFSLSYDTDQGEDADITTMYVMLTNKTFHPHNAIDNVLINWIVVDYFYCMAKRVSNGDVENLSLTWAIYFPHTFKANPGSVILFSNMH